MEFSNSGRTELSSIGEFGLINEINKKVKLRNPSSVKGIGDDAAVMDYGNKLTVISTDMLVEGVHFDLSYTPLKHLGYKAVISNLSDIYAMNAKPEQVTMSIAVSNRFSLEAIHEFYDGVFLACEVYHVDLVGGDTTSSNHGFTISVTAAGHAEKEDLVYRNGAGENDLVCVSGDLGAAFLGLQVLEREKRIFLESPGVQPDLSGNDYILEKQLKPEARKDVFEKLKEMNIKPTSMIDISDGLASELLHICNQSEKGAVIYEEKIPIDQNVFNTALDFNLIPTVCAMNGGEDYELLFTVRLSDYEKLKTLKEISVIGHITEKKEGVFLVEKGGIQVPITAQGWDALIEKRM